MRVGSVRLAIEPCWVVTNKFHELGKALSSMVTTWESEKFKSAVV